MSGKKDLSGSTIIEDTGTINIYRDTDVLVVGGGPAGIGAALAATRNGARTILLERFGYLGGLATGGFVLCIMPMSDGTNKQQIAGICQEIIDRLDDVGAAVHPRKEDLGSNDKKLIDYWRRYPFTVIGDRIVLSAQIDPEILKCLLNDMMEEAGVELLLHSLGCRAIVEGNCIKGVFFESKSGRQAILAKTVIDTTGDGDIYSSAGAAFDGIPKSDQRAAKLSFTFRFSNIDSNRFYEFKETEKTRFAVLMKECTKKGGFTHAISCIPDDVMWFNDQLSGFDGLDVKDLTRVEITGRKRMRITYDFFKKNVPGFENCYLMDTATQTGVRCTRRLTGEYMVTMEDIESGVVHEDTILEAPSFMAPVTEKPHIHVPYRCLVPDKVDNLLTAGRCVSADEFAINILSPIQFCIGTGQAAGTAAAIAINEDITPRMVHYDKLQEYLISQGGESVMKSYNGVKNGITRREFVRNTAIKGVAAFAIGAGGMAIPISTRAAESTKISGKTIKEAARETKVCRTADVVVVGGGPGGIGAAVSAARNGADTVLIERYEHLGGMGTGGLVTIIPAMTDINGKQVIAGITQEWIERLDKREAADYPKKEHWGSTDKKLIDYYKNRSFFYATDDRVGYSAHIDAEISKCLFQDMMEEAGIKTYLHSWGTEPVMDGNKARGVIFESKSGRQAVLAKVVIDSTGDGDLLPYAGADFETHIERTMRIANLSFSYWIDNVNLKKYQDYKNSNAKELAEKMRDVKKLGGTPGFMTSNLKNQENVVWCFPRYANTCQYDVEELTRVEFLGRKEMLITHDFYKKHIPGFEKSFIVLSNSQLGTRGGRRVVGDYVVREEDMKAKDPFQDTIAIFPNMDDKNPLMYMPFRCLIPRNVDNMLVACRAFSSDAVINDYFNLIHHCISLGEAAGAAAAQAVNVGVDVRKVDIKALQTTLKNQGVVLPG